MAVLRPQFPDHGSPFSRRAERDRKSAAIRSAAARRFNVQGVRGARLEDIAADLGLTKTSISYYYQSKEDLAEAVFLSAVAFLEEAVDTASGTQSAPGHKILHLFEAYKDQLHEALDDQRPFPAQLKELDVLSETVQARIAARLSASVERVNALVLSWLEHSATAPRRSEPVTFCLFGLLDWLTVRSNEASAAQFKRSADVLVDILRSGLTSAGPVSGRLSARFGAPDELSLIFDREARNRMKREAFLKAGIRYFNLYGFEGVSLADVAGSLGVTRGAFYYHIPDKESFLDQCLDRSLDAVEATFDAGAETCEGLDFLKRVLFDLVYLQASGVEPIIRLELMAALPPGRRARYQARLRSISRRLGDAHEAAASDDMARARDTASVEAILTSVMFINGGFTLAATNALDDWRMSRNPQSDTNDYLHVLFYGLTARAE